MQEALMNRLAPIGASKHYQVMPTIDIVQEAEKFNYKVSAYSQKRCRNADKLPFTKHMVRLRMNDVVPVVNDIVPEILVINSHDKTTRLQFMLGFFRFICANGLVTGDIFESYSYKHNDSNPFEKILAQFEQIKDVAHYRLDTIKDMKRYDMSQQEQYEFAREAAKLTPTRVYENVIQLTHASRDLDNVPTLWHTFNRVQENMINGNVQLLSTNNRARKARPVKSLDANLDINRGLWNLAEGWLSRPQQQLAMAA